MTSQNITRENLIEYCYEIDSKYKIRNANIIYYNRDKKSTITINQNYITTVVYVPFYYKNVPVKINK